MASLRPILCPALKCMSSVDAAIAARRVAHLNTDISPSSTVIQAGRRARIAITVTFALGLARYIGTTRDEWPHEDDLRAHRSRERPAEGPRGARRPTGRSHRLSWR